MLGRGKPPPSVLSAMKGPVNSVQSVAGVEIIPPLGTVIPCPSACPRRDNYSPPPPHFAH